jgi:hypothetical protein
MERFTPMYHTTTEILSRARRVWYHSSWNFQITAFIDATIIWSLLSKPESLKRETKWAKKFKLLIFFFH